MTKPKLHHSDSTVQQQQVSEKLFDIPRKFKAGAIGTGRIQSINDSASHQRRLQRSAGPTRPTRVREEERSLERYLERVRISGYHSWGGYECLMSVPSVSDSMKGLEGRPADDGSCLRPLC